MTQVITVEASESIKLDLSGYGQLDTPSGESERYNPHRFEYRYYLTDTEGRDDVKKDLEAQLDGIEWAQVTWRWRGDEYVNTEYRDDPEYHLQDHDLVTPISFEINGWDLEVSYAGETWTEAYNPPEEGYSDTHTVTRDGITLGTVTVKEPLDRIPRNGPKARNYPPPAPEREVLVSIGDRPEGMPTDQRLHRIAKGVGADGAGQRGIAQRIDDLEDRVGELEGE